MRAVQDLARMNCLLSHCRRLQHCVLRLLLLGLSVAAAGQTTGPQQLAFAGLRSIAQKGQINAVQADSSGNLYLLVNQGDGVRLLKTDNSAYTILAQTQVGANGDTGIAMALDIVGNVYVTGTTSSTSLTGTAGAAIPARTDASTNSFVAKWDTNLNLQWLSFTGGSRIAASAIASTADAVYITGIIYATNLPVTATGIQQSPALGSSQNGFVERFSASGTTLVYATYLTGASGDTTPTAIAADANDNAYVAGSTTASGFPTIAALVPAMLSNPSGFIAKVDPAGDQIIASTFIPGAGLTSMVYDSATQTLLASGSVALGQFPVANVASPLIPSTYQVLLRLPLSLGAVNGSTIIAPGTQSNVAAGAGGFAWVDGILSAPLLPLTPLSSMGYGFAARVNASGAVDQTARFGGLANGNASFASLPATITSVAIDPTGDALIGGAMQPTASSSLLATETYDLPLSNAPTAAFPSTITDAELTAATCNGSLCAGSAAYLAKVTPAAGTSLAFSTGALPWVTLRNLGSTEAGNLTLTATGATLATNCASILSAGAECDLLLSGGGAGSITVGTSNAGSRTISFPAFKASSNTVVFFPKELDFGIQTSTSAAATRTITVTNLGTTSQTFTSAIYASTKAAASPFTEFTSDCPTTGSTTTKLLPAEATCHITIAFTAYSSSNSDGALQADWSIGANTVALTGFSQAAALSISASEIDFGTQYSNGIRLPRYLYLSNASSAAVAHTAVSLAAGSAFTLADNCPSTLVAGTVCQIRIDYQAASATSNDAVTVALDGGLSVLLTGKTLPPQTVGGTTANPNLAVTPLSVAFSSPVVVTGVSSSTQTVAVTNSGASAFPLTTSLTGDFTEVTSCVATLAAGATCAVAVTFAPSQPGVRQGTLAVTAGAGTSPISVALSGTATAILPSNNGNLDFGSSTVGQPAVQFYKIAQPLSSLSVTTSGPWAAVLVQDAGYGPGSPPVSAYANHVTGACPDCYLGLSFTPTAAGPQAGSVTLSSAAQGSPYTLALSGIGTALTGLILTPVAQDFGTVPLGSSSGSLSFTLTNLLASGSAATLTSATTGDFAIVSSQAAQSCGATLAYTSSCTVQVAFSPTNTGARTGTLSFTSGSNVATAALTGTAIAAPVISVSPTSLTFTNSTGMAATQQTVTLINNGTTNVQISTPSVTTTAFAPSTSCGTLAAGAGCNITVHFTPRQRDRAGHVIHHGDRRRWSIDGLYGGAQRSIHRVGRRVDHRARDRQLWIGERRHAGDHAAIHHHQFHAEESGSEPRSAAAIRADGRAVYRVACGCKLHLLGPVRAVDQWPDLRLNPRAGVAERWLRAADQHCVRGRVRSGAGNADIERGADRLGCLRIRASRVRPDGEPNLQPDQWQLICYDGQTCHQRAAVPLDDELRRLAHGGTIVRGDCDLCADQPGRERNGFTRGEQRRRHADHRERRALESGDPEPDWASGTDCGIKSGRDSDTRDVHAVAGIADLRVGDGGRCDGRTDDHADQYRNAGDADCVDLGGRWTSASRAIARRSSQVEAA